MPFFIDFRFSAPTSPILRVRSSFSTDRKVRFSIVDGCKNEFHTMSRAPSYGTFKVMKISKMIHQETVPVLISPVMLRKFKAGQVDIAFLDAKKLFLIEVKNSKYPKLKQIQRLKNSQEFLSCVFNCEVMLLTYNNKKNQFTAL